MHKGGTPILTAGLKVQPWSQGGKDAATADMIKLSNEHIALAFRIPLQIFGMGGTPFSSTEALMQSWKASGLGFALNHIEDSIGLLFLLKGQPDEYCEFDTDALLRSAMKDRIEALARGVQGGIFAPNEARQSEGLDKVAFGDEPRVQQQVVPLSAAGAIPAAPGPQAAPTAPAVPEPKPQPPQKGNRDDINREVRNLFATADRIGRRRNSN
jgi:phage portal protein BeeE